MDYKHDLGAELLVHFLNHAFFGAACVEAELLDARYDIAPTLAVSVRVSFSLLGFIF